MGSTVIPVIFAHVSTLDRISGIVNKKVPFFRYFLLAYSFTSLVIALAMTGMRLGEIRALRREDIKDGYLEVLHSFDRTVGIKETKAGKVRHVPIPPGLRDDLLHWAPVNGFIFSLDGGQTPVNSDYMIDNLYYRMDDLGMDYRLRRLCFHSWRHFFNTRLIANGVQGEVTRAIVGHQSEDMTEIYLHLKASDMKMVARVQDELVAVVG